jgi:hypothetical protein
MDVTRADLMCKHRAHESVEGARVECDRERRRKPVFDVDCSNEDDKQPS